MYGIWIVAESDERTYYFHYYLGIIAKVNTCSCFVHLEFGYSYKFNKDYQMNWFAWTNMLNVNLYEERNK